MTKHHFHSADGAHHEVEAESEEAGVALIEDEYRKRNTAPNAGPQVSPHPIRKVDTTFAKEEKEEQEGVKGKVLRSTMNQDYSGAGSYDGANPANAKDDIAREASTGSEFRDELGASVASDEAEGPKKAANGRRKDEGANGDDDEKKKTLSF